jgi:hypothetical protein
MESEFPLSCSEESSNSHFINEIKLLATNISLGLHVQVFNCDIG